MRSMASRYKYLPLGLVIVQSAEDFYIYLYLHVCVCIFILINSLYLKVKLISF